MVAGSSPARPTSHLKTIFRICFQILAFSSLIDSFKNIFSYDLIRHPNGVPLPSLFPLDDATPDRGRKSERRAPERSHLQLCSRVDAWWLRLARDQSRLPHTILAALYGWNRAPHQRYTATDVIWMPVSMPSGEILSACRF